MTRGERHTIGAWKNLRPATPMHAQFAISTLSASQPTTHGLPGCVCRRLLPPSAFRRCPCARKGSRSIPEQGLTARRHTCRQGWCATKLRAASHRRRRHYCHHRHRHCCRRHQEGEGAQGYVEGGAAATVPVHGAGVRVRGHAQAISGRAHEHPQRSQAVRKLPCFHLCCLSPARASVRARCSPTRCHPPPCYAHNGDISQALGCGQVQMHVGGLQLCLRQ